MQWPIIPIKNLTSLFPLIFLSKHICLYALCRIKLILGIIWPWNQHFKLKNQRNWIKQVLMIKFLSGINCILLHRPKKLTFVQILCSHGNVLLKNCTKRGLVLSKWLKPYYIEEFILFNMILNFRTISHQLNSAKSIFFLCLLLFIYYKF